MSKPDFIGVGMERAGTSWVFSMIAHHPDVWVPPLKELHFLDALDADVPCHNPRYKWHLTSRLKHKFVLFFDFKSRPEFFKNSYFKYLLWDFYYFIGRINFQWYQRLFSTIFTKGRIAGEFTPAYCNIDESYIKQLLQINSEIKFLIMVRHPEHQLRSSLIQHFVMIKGLSFDSVTEDEMQDWLNSDFADKKSNIEQSLVKWQAVAPKGQLFVGLYEEMSAEPLSFIKRIYTFLGLDHSFLPNKETYERKINNLTKKSYVIPPKIEELIAAKVKNEVEYFEREFPSLSHYWSKN